MDELARAQERLDRAEERAGRLFDGMMAEKDEERFKLFKAEYEKANAHRERAHRAIEKLEEAESKSYTLPLSFLKRVGVHEDCESLHGCLMYTTVTLTNDYNVEDKRVLEAELLIDTGATVEMYLPPRHAFRLGLQREGVRAIGALYGQPKQCYIFRPVKVEIKFMDPVEKVERATRSAFLEPYSPKDGFDELMDPTLQRVAGSPGVDGEVKLSPLKRPSDPTSVAFGILGKLGLAKLHVHVDPELKRLFPLVQQEFMPFWL